MKKILNVLIVLCIAVSFAACSSNNNSPKKETNTNSQDADVLQKSNDETFGLNDTAVFENLKITAVKLEESAGKEYFYAEDGKIFAGVKFEIENISDKPQNISSLLLFDAYADDVKCEYSLSANVAFDEGALDGEISPGKKMVGWYAVEVPKEWTQLELEVKAEWLSDSKAKFVFKK